MIYGIDFRFSDFRILGKNITILAVFSALILSSSALLSACSAPPFGKTEINREDIKTLSVTGVGEVSVKPDLFVLSGAIIQKDKTSQQAMNALAGIVNTIQERAADNSNLTSRDFSFATVNTAGIKDAECLLWNEEAERTNSTLRPGERRVQKRVCKDQFQQASSSWSAHAANSSNC